MNDIGTILAALTLKDVLDLGTTGLLVIVAITLWRRLNKMTDQLIEVRQKVELVAGAVVPVVAPEPTETTDQATPATKPPKTTAHAN